MFAVKRPLPLHEYPNPRRPPPGIKIQGKSPRYPQSSAKFRKKVRIEDEGESKSKEERRKSKRKKERRTVIYIL